MFWGNNHRKLGFQCNGYFRNVASNSQNTMYQHWPQPNYSTRALDVPSFPQVSNFLLINFIMALVAFSKSSVVKYLTLSSRLLSLRCCRYALNLDNHATFLCSTVQEEYLTSSSCNLPEAVTVNMAFSFLTSKSSSGSSPKSAWGHSSSGLTEMRDR